MESYDGPLLWLRQTWRLCSKYCQIHAASCAETVFKRGVHLYSSNNHNGFEDASPVDRLSIRN